MTVSSEETKKTYAGNGSLASFSTVFTFDANSEVTVSLSDDTTGVSTPWVEGTQYNLTGAGTGVAGTIAVVTTPTDYTPLTGETLVVELIPSFTQPTPLPRGGTVSPKAVLEPMHDNRVRQSLRVKELTERAIRTPAADSTPGLTLPIANLRANKVLAFDGNGDIDVSDLDLDDIESGSVDAANSAAAAAVSEANAAASATEAATSAGEASQYASGESQIKTASGSETDTTFIAGTSTTITLTNVIFADEKYLQIYFDGVKRHRDEWSLSDDGTDTTVTFSSGAIPVGTQSIECDWGVRSASIANGVDGLTASEVNQLENIDSTTISQTQWGYLGDFDQALTTTSNAQFNSVNASQLDGILGQNTPAAIIGTTGSFSGDITFTAADALLKRGTSDGSDDERQSFVGGGGYSQTRGASVRVSGNEHATTPGELRLQSGEAGDVVIASGAGAAAAITVDSSQVSTFSAISDMSAAGVYLGAASASNLLDYYEEGTFTPTFTTNGTDFDSVTYDSIRQGRYTRIGRIVICTVNMRTDAVTVGSATGTVAVGGLPFTSAASGQDAGAGYFGQTSAWAGDTPTSARIFASDTQANLLYRTAANGATSFVATSDVETGGNGNAMFGFNFIYEVA